MERVNYQIIINAPPADVYRTMLNKKAYTEWTSVFNPDSHFEGTWEKGEKMLFIGTDGNGDIGGMVSRIKENIAGKLVSIEHIGFYRNGKEIFTGADVEKWTGGIEEYFFEEKNGKTHLSVFLDVDEEMRDYFSKTYPKALEKLKDICEK